MYNYQGFWTTKEFVEGPILLNKTIKLNQLIYSSAVAQKPGTTWLKALAFAIATREKFNQSTTPLLTTMPHDGILFLEKDLDHIKINQKTDFPLIGTHLPCVRFVAQSVIASHCKIVYIYRNTKDAIVSYYKFVQKVLKILDENCRFEEAFEQFCQGISWYGPYWEHILGYWKASLERPGKVLFLKYEDMKKDAVNDVKRLAEFLGYPFSSEEEKVGVIDNIIELCSFEKLSNLEVNKSGVHRLRTQNRFYFRKAKDGDWENYFPNDMKEKIDKLMEEKLTGTGLILK